MNSKPAPTSLNLSGADNANGGRGVKSNHPGIAPFVVKAIKDRLIKLHNSGKLHTLLNCDANVLNNAMHDSFTEELHNG